MNLLQGWPTISFAVDAIPVDDSAEMRERR
jgi:hypothetical protein